VAALGDTLYPAASLASGVANEFAAGAPVLLRLRLIHPLVAVAAGIYLMRCGRAVWVLVLVQFAAGLLNWILLAPIWMQLVHLLIANLLWIALVLRHLQTRTVI
jgi:heme A synthase